MRTVFQIAFLLLISITANAQMDTSLFLISKVDFQPQYVLSDGKQVELMGYSKTIGGALVLPSPTLEIEEGDSVNLSFWNLSQGAPHTIHLHGLDVNQEYDGVPMLSFEVAHDDTGSYYFQAPHPGTYLYHCHVTSVLHVQGGMYGMVIVRPKNNPNQSWNGGYDFDSERAWLLSELDTNWHHDSIINHPHDPMAMTHVILPYKPQHYLVNGKSETQLDATPFQAAVGEKVYLRLANIGYYGNQIVFPAGLQAQIVSSDGRPLPTAYASDTLDIFPGERFEVLVEATSEFVDAIQFNYIDMNTQTIANTQEVEVIIAGFMGQDELNDPLYFYPNPATNVLNVSENGVWSIYTIAGQLVKTETTDNYQLNVSDLQEGSYLLRSPSETTKKLLIFNY